MKLLLDTSCYKLFEVDSESELKNQENILLLIPNSEYQRKFYKIEIGNTILGVINEGHGIIPKIKEITEDIYLISSDFSIYFVDKCRQMVVEKKWTLLFMKFIFASKRFF